MSATVFSATDAVRLIAIAAPGSLDAAMLTESDTVVATMCAESVAVTERLAPLTAPFPTDAATVLPIELVTTLSAPATETENADTATAIEAEIAFAITDDDSDALTVTAPVTVTGLASTVAVTTSWTPLKAFAPAIATATPAPSPPSATLRLAAMEVATMVALSFADTDSAAPPTGALGP